MSQDTDSKFMKMALKQATLAAQKGEVPVGAVVVQDTERGPIVVAKGANCRETLHDPTGHAELIALKKASKKLEKWRLSDCTLYVTLEPCLMCAGSIVLSRVKRVVYGATDPKAGAVESLYQVLEDKRLNHRPKTSKGVLGADCGQILKDFFKAKRSANKNL